MYRAKRAGGGDHRIVDLREQHLAEHHASLGRDLHGVLGRDELHIEYQPIVATLDGRVTGVEALLRWAHPDRGLVGPNVLIPIAERSGMITKIGQWVLEQAWAEQKRWQREHGGRLAMSVNVSAHQFMSAGFADTVAEVLAASRSDPGLLTLEVTESVFVRDGERALGVLNDLKDLGLMLALDDFGTGYSSLSYLKRFPVDIVKIDRAFISDLGRDPASRTIVAAVVQLAHGLGMTVTAEGVETVQQRREILGLGCDSCQGFYFAEPMPVADLEALMDQAVAQGSSLLPLVPTANTA